MSPSAPSAFLTHLIGQATREELLLVHSPQLLDTIGMIRDAGAVGAARRLRGRGAIGGTAGISNNAGRTATATKGKRLADASTANVANVANVAESPYTAEVIDDLKSNGQRNSIYFNENTAECALYAAGSTVELCQQVRDNIRPSGRGQGYSTK